MIKAFLIALIVLFSNNLFYSQIFYSDLDEKTEGYSVVYQDEFSVFNQQQYSYNDLSYEFSSKDIVSQSYFMPVIAEDLLLDNQGGEHKDYLKLCFYDNPKLVDDFVAKNRTIAKGDYPLKQNECIISDVLAYKNNISLNDTIEVVGYANWDITFKLKVVGIYYDNTYPLDVNKQYTSRRNEIITFSDTLNKHEFASQMMYSTHLSSFVLVADNVESPHAIGAYEFYSYIQANMDRYALYSLVLLAICIGLYIIFEFLDRIIIKRIIRSIKELNSGFKGVFSRRFNIIYILLSIVIFICVLLAYRPINRTLIIYLLNLNSGFSIHSAGYQIPELLSGFYYVVGNAQTVFNVQFIAVFVVWLCYRQVKFNRLYKEIQGDISEKVIFNENTIVVFKHDEDIMKFKKESNLFYLQKIQGFSRYIVKVLYGVKIPKDSEYDGIRKQLDFAKEKGVKRILVEQSILDYQKYKELFDEYDFVLIYCTCNIVPTYNFKVQAYVKNKCISLL